MVKTCYSLVKIFLPSTVRSVIWIQKNKKRANDTRRTLDISNKTNELIRLPYSAIWNKVATFIKIFVMLKITFKVTTDHLSLVAMKIYDSVDSILKNSDIHLQTLTLWNVTGVSASWKLLNQVYGFLQSSSECYKT